MTDQELREGLISTLEAMWTDERKRRLAIIASFERQFEAW